MVSEEIRDRVLNSIREDEIVGLAKSLIQIPSFTTEETTLARFLARFMEQEGMEPELQEVDPGRFQVIARIRGAGSGKSLMLNSHIDSERVLEGWTRDPWVPTLRGDRLYGQGILNMKAGLTSMVMAGRAIQRSGVKLHGDLVMACVAGGLQGGYGTARLLEGGLRSDMAVVTKPSGARTITTTHCGAMQVAIHTIGLSQHISRKEESIDAMQKMIKVFEALNRMEFSCKKREDLPGLPRLLAGSVIGGRGRNYMLRGLYGVCDFCTLLVDVRLLPGQTADEARQDIVNVLDGIAKDDPEFRYEMEIPPGKPFTGMVIPIPPMEVPADQPILQMVRRNYEEVTGRKIRKVGIEIPISYTESDGSRLWQAGIPCCCYGPGDGISDPGKYDRLGKDRFISIKEMVICAKVLAFTALEACA